MGIHRLTHQIQLGIWLFATLLSARITHHGNQTLGYLLEKGIVEAKTREDTIRHTTEHIPVLVEKIEQVLTIGLEREILERQGLWRLYVRNAIILEFLQQTVGILVLQRIVLYHLLELLIQFLSLGIYQFHQRHSVLYTSLQMEIILKRFGWPEVYTTDYLVWRTDTVDTSETLDETNRIPMDIEVNLSISILQVLTFRQAVGGYQNINAVIYLLQGLCIILRYQLQPLLITYIPTLLLIIIIFGSIELGISIHAAPVFLLVKLTVRRKAFKHSGEVLGTVGTCGKDILPRSGSHARKTSLLQLIEDKLGCIGKGCEDDNLLVFGFLLLIENSHKFFQLQVFLLASLIVSSKSLKVLVDFLQFIDIHLQISDETTQVLHIRQFDGSLTEGISLIHQIVDFLIIKISIAFSSTSRDSSIATFFLELQGKFQGAFMHIEYLLHRSHAGIPGTFQTLHK